MYKNILSLFIEVLIFAMLSKAMEWRHQYKINTTLDDYVPPEVFAKYFSAGYTVAGKQHSKLMIARFGAMDLRGMLLSAKKRDYSMTVIHLVERDITDARKNPTKFKKSPDSIFQMTVIFDMAGFSPLGTWDPIIYLIKDKKKKIKIMVR